ncbi:MAG: RnfABCDGE type electron transport complex subunit D, partial [Oscillospiraceae bacterium]|nr:RnfABCDGE type electron transport complex subunit D [Oscillospiraceae bacterium]
MDREGHAGAELCVGYDRRFLSKESAHWIAEVLTGCGYRVLMITIVTVGSAVLSEYLCRKVMKRHNTIGDLSAVVTGL